MRANNANDQGTMAVAVHPRQITRWIRGQMHSLFPGDRYRDNYVLMPFEFVVAYAVIK